jgi:hypothetical protein
MEKHVWQFTNQKKLTKKQFIDYFERKVFRTIRKYEMLPKNRVIHLKKSENLNTIVLKKILEKKFSVEFSKNPNFSSENLSQCAEEIFQNILKGNFSGLKPKDRLARPLYFLSDREVELYAKLNNIKGTKRKKDEKIQALFEKFLEKNPDLEINIVRALGQIFQ